MLLQITTSNLFSNLSNKVIQKMPILPTFCITEKLECLKPQIKFNIYRNRIWYTKQPYHAAQETIRIAMIGTQVPTHQKPLEVKH